MTKKYGQDRQGRPRIVLSDDYYSKIIQLNIQGLPYFRAWKNTLEIVEIHGNILERILREFGIIKFDRFKGPVSKESIPVAEGNNYQLAGAGEMFWKKHKNEIDVIGKSSDYRITVNKENLIELLPYFPDDMAIKFNGEILQK